MKEGLLGRKRGMTQVFGEDGSRIPVTVLEAGPCTVVAAGWGGWVAAGSVGGVLTSTTAGANS